MPRLVNTPTFERWLAKLKDRRAGARIDVRLKRLAQGQFGDFRGVGEGVCELRIDYGPGYRLYFVEKDMDIIVLL